ncbi:hypothetical protein RFC94_004705, partial [Klebsiella pneumoniae]
MTMTEKIIALVDYENIGTLESVRLSRYERLILFTGPQQEFIRFPAVTYAGDISVSVFQVANVSTVFCKNGDITNPELSGGKMPDAGRNM